MEQRRLRLGDILDDYCPRERRITNHAVVAMIDDEVKQTRCTTCDADHEYKHGRIPAPRRRKAAGALFAEAADGTEPRPVLAAAPPSDDPDFDQAPEQPEFAAADESHVDAVDAEAPITDDMDDDDAPRAGLEDEGPVHRRLIRATLPRPEGQTPERREPEFTIRQPGGRGFNNGNRSNGFRGRGGERGMRGPAGQGGGPTRFGGGQRQGQSQGQGNRRQGGGGGQNRGGSRGGHGRKRGR
jgi:hypothetical protein